MNANIAEPDARPDELSFITKRIFAQRMSVSLRTTDNWLRLRKIPFCKFGKIVRIPWPEAREHCLRNYKINAHGE